MVGSSISHYKVLEKLGEGGMGVVYKAEDTTLERTVALKFLAAHLLNDAEAKERFLREAKAAAALDHPNICTVYEIAEADGKTFLAMAFLKGETLEDRIAKGPLSFKDVLDFGRQVAEGLQAAHGEGIVHRDIKPANVLLSPEGRATIMDFGLARLTEASRLTKAEQTVGTAAYMSPEQMQGAEVDHRTDIWALGCLLYEMVAGARAFKGEYQQALAYEIVSQEPEPLTGVRSGVPMELEFMVGKCLAKAAADRYQQANEIAVDLRTLSEKLKSGRSTILQSREMPTRSGPPASSLETEPEVGVSTQASPEAKPAGRTARLPWVVAAVCLLAAAYFAVANLRTPQLATKTVRYELPPPPESSYDRGAAISPDGRLIAFAARAPGAGRQRRLWVRRLDSLTAQPLEGTVGAQHPFWSPDSKHIGYFTQGSLKRVSMSGGPSTTLADVDQVRGGTWNGDGLILFSVASGLGGLHQIPAAGGIPEPVTQLDRAAGEIEHLWPYFLPDGQRFLYLSVIDGRDTQELNAAALDGSAPKPLMATNARAEYADGHILFIRDSTLTAQPFDPAQGELAGDPFPVAENVGNEAIRYSSYFSTSKDGVLIYVRQAEEIWPLKWFDRSGDVLSSLGGGSFAGGHAAISPDGTRVAFDIVEPGGANQDIWVRDLERGVNSRLTFDVATDWVSTWSPDGSRLVFTSDRGDAVEQLYQTRISILVWRHRTKVGKTRFLNCDRLAGLAFDAASSR